jgi:hypothetical protein
MRGRGHRDVLGEALDQTEQGCKPQRHRGAHANIKSVTRLLVLLVACGGCAGTPNHPAAAIDHGAAPVTEVAPSEHECDALFAHVAELAAADQRAAMPQSPATEADVAADQAALHASAMTECRAMRRATWGCAVAAPSSELMVACDRGSP